jgi:hypothetical protein
VPTLIVGVLVVAVSTAGFVVTMFGRRPLPQSATTTVDPVAPPVTPTRERRRISRRAVRAADAAVDPAPDVVPRLHVQVPAAIRIRSAFLLALGVIAAAAAIGVLLSVAVVGLFTLIG